MIKIVMLIAVISLLFMLCLQSVSAADIYVAPGASIQSAYDGAGSGDTIILQNGTHTLSSSITFTNSPANKNINIRGDGSTTLNAATFTLIVSAGAASNNQRIVNISNMTITGTTNDKISIQANNIVNVNNVHFTGLTGTGRGIQTNAANVDITVNNSQFTNLLSGSVSGKGINGGTSANSGSLKVYNTKFINIYSSGTGVAINYEASSSSYVYINNSVFEDCGSSSVGGVIRCYYGAGVTINNTNFTNGYTSSHGGIFCLNGAGSYLVVDNSRFTNCRTTSSQGGVTYTHQGTTTISNTLFENCSASGEGGVIYNLGTGLITLTNCTFNTNNATSGGVIYAASSGTILIFDSKFNGNFARTSTGGAIHAAGGTINITNTLFNGNYANTQGGAIFATAGTINVINSNFTNNYASTYGGAVGANGGTINVNISKFTGNYVTSTASYGGALGTPSGTINVYNSEFAFNNATNTNSYGGVAGVNGASAAITLVNCSVHDNSADFSGAFGAGTLGGTINVINNTAIYNNHANTYGGVVGLNGPGTIVISNSVIYNNYAGTYGGAFAANGGTINVTNSTIRNNSAGTFGGAVAVNGAGTINIVDSNMINNTATTYGGAAGVNGLGTINIRNSALTGNRVTAGFGGAVGVNGNGNIFITGSNLTNNFASTFGGASGLEGSGTITINNSNMNNNNASDFGGAAGLNGNGRIDITNANMFDNVAINFGGAVGVSSPAGTGTINVRNSQLVRNKATGLTGYGGAVGLTQGIINVYDSTFTNNSATDYGGAVGVPVTGTFYAEGSVFHNNQAITGYGGAIGSGAGVNIVLCNFTNNKAATFGGGVAAMAAPGIPNSIQRCQFEYNFAGTDGYAIYAANLLKANYNRFFNNTDPTGSLAKTIVTQYTNYPNVDIDFNWWGDNVTCAGANTPNNWVVVNVDCDNPIIAGGYANYTYTIGLDGNPSSFGGFNPFLLPPFFGKGVFTTPPGLPIFDFNAHANTTISVPYDANNRYQVGYFQVDNWISHFTIDTRVKPNVVINAPTGRYKDNVTLNATYTDSIGAPIPGLIVNFYVGGVLVGTNTTDSNGFVTCRYTVASAGNLLYAAYYTGNHLLFGTINTTQMLTFTKLGTTTTVNSVNNPLIVGSRNNITATVLDVHGAPVVGFMVDFFINNVYIGSNRTNAQGIAFFSFLTSNDPDDQYNISARFNETGNYTSAADTYGFGARKMNTAIVISEVITKPFRNTRIAITLLNEFGNPIPFQTITGTINGIPFTAAVGANGIAYIYYNASIAGNVPIQAIFAESFMYFGTTQDGVLIVELLNTSIKFKNTIVNALQNASFMATLVDEDGVLLTNRFVDVYVNDDFIGTFETDAYARIYIDLGLLPIGNYSITATFAGDPNLRAASNSSTTFTVRPIQTTISVSVFQNKSDSTQFVARLLDEFNNPLSDMPILFYLNGQFIGIAVTDSNGIARLPYSYTPSGKIMVEFLGESVYQESLNNRPFGPNDVIPFPQPIPNNNTFNNTNNTNNNESHISLLKTGNPLAMILLCLLSILFIGFNRRRKI